MCSTQPIHVEIRCDFCSTHNELTVRDVVESQLVHCSQCGGVLGSIASLREATAKPAGR